MPLGRAVTLKGRYGRDAAALTTEWTRVSNRMASRRHQWHTEIPIHPDSGHPPPQSTVQYESHPALGPPAELNEVGIMMAIEKELGLAWDGDFCNRLIEEKTTFLEFIQLAGQVRAANGI